jgi:hypothetical protein
MYQRLPTPHGAHVRVTKDWDPPLDDGLDYENAIAVRLSSFSVRMWIVAWFYRHEPLWLLPRQPLRVYTVSQSVICNSSIAIAILGMAFREVLR